MPRQQPIHVVVEKPGGCLSGCGTAFAVLLLIALAVKYWYVVVGILAIAGLLAAVQRARNREQARQEQARAQRQSLSGLLLPATGEIWVNAEEGRQWPARRRFTIAHELGHWRLHRDAEERAVFCRKGSIEPDPAQAHERLPPAEDEANVFAAAVLMPARLVQEQYVRCERDFFGLCDTFGASGAAMGRRLHAVIPRQ